MPLKTDCSRYFEACDEYLAEAGDTRTVEQAGITFRKEVNKVSCLSVYACHIRRFLPTLQVSAKSHADEVQNTAQTAIPTAVINSSIDIHASRHK